MFEDSYKNDLINIVNDLSSAIFDLYESNGVEYDDVCELVDMLHDEVEVA